MSKKRNYLEDSSDSIQRIREDLHISEKLTDEEVAESLQLSLDDLEKKSRNIVQKVASFFDPNTLKGVSGLSFAGGTAYAMLPEGWYSTVGSSLQSSLDSLVEALPEGLTSTVSTISQQLGSVDWNAVTTGTKSFGEAIEGVISAVTSAIGIPAMPGAAAAIASTILGLKFVNFLRKKYLNGDNGAQPAVA